VVSGSALPILKRDASVMTPTGHPDNNAADVGRQGPPAKDCDDGLTR
jgi:hypothetical protein